MSFHIIIPARLKSTRLPNKPLADIHGEPMIVRVAKQALSSHASSVTVAADDASIVQACEQYQVRAILTDVNHPSGSDRLAQAAQLLNLEANDIVVNVQGDEPLIDPDLINACAMALQQNPDCAMSTAATPIHNKAAYSNPNIVKVVCNAKGHALYFSRAPIPWWRDGNLNLVAGMLPEPPSLVHIENSDAATQTNADALPLQHIGIYAYRVDFLSKFPTLQPAPLEKLESLEQLRALWHGEHIAVHITEKHPGPGVDTSQDLEQVRELFAAKY